MQEKDEEKEREKGQTNSERARGYREIERDGQRDRQRRQTEETD